MTGQRRKIFFCPVFISVQFAVYQVYPNTTGRKEHPPKNSFYRDCHPNHAVGNNFNQVVKKLHTLHQIAEFKSWLIAYEVEKKTLFYKVDDVKNRIQKISETWLQ